jgi:2-succinyl-6-hydroxy-2,4-cyclohexadiene-1-carboxylate synthase
VSVPGRSSGHNTGVPPDDRDRDRLASLVAGNGPRVVLLHGFTQTARCWGPFADTLVEDGWQLRSVDAPGHGRSSSIDADVPSGAQLLGDVGGRAVYVGYSMGARYALQLALDRPELVRALVLIGVSPGIEDARERAARIADDEARAARIEAIGVEAFVDEWLRQPLFATLPADAAHRDERLTNTTAGLASSLRRSGTGAMEPLWPRLPDIRVPVVLVTGELDAKFGPIAQRMVPLMAPHAIAVSVPDAGHTVHLEKPGVLADFVRTWLRKSGLAPD